MDPFPEDIDLQARHKRFDTIDEYIEALAGWETEISQLDAGSFECHQTVVGNDSCRYIFIQHDLRVLVRAYNPGPAIQFYVPLCDEQLLNFLHVSTPRPSVACVPAGHQVSLITPSDFDGVLFLVDPDHFCRAGSDCFTGTDFDLNTPGNFLFPAGPDNLKTLRSAIQDIKLAFWSWKRGEISFDNFNHTVQHNSDHQVIPELQAILTDTCAESPPPKPKLLLSSLQILLDNIDSPPTIRELATTLGTSERNLQYLYKTYIGLSPKQLIRLHRLNVARRRLWQSPYQRGLVADIANQLGFWHMGYFAQDFKRLFHKNPSEVLSIDPCLCDLGTDCDCQN